MAEARDDEKLGSGDALRRILPMRRQQDRIVGAMDDERRDLSVFSRSLRGGAAMAAAIWRAAEGGSYGV